MLGRKNMSKEKELLNDKNKIQELDNKIEKDKLELSSDIIIEDKEMNTNIIRKET
jgi:hypothetical protein